MKILCKRIGKPLVAIHCGAGCWSRILGDPAYPYSVDDIINCVREVLVESYRVLCSEGYLKSVVEAVKHLEDTGMFNAGIGSALNLFGEPEMDAAVMSSDGFLGVVGAVKYPKNPVELAYLVPIETEHNMLVSCGADILAEKKKLKARGATPEYIVEIYNKLLSRVRRGWYECNRWKKLSKLVKLYEYSMDTVGAVAVDSESRLAAALSTGGIWLKHPGRIGDTAHLGSGFYVTKNVAVVATGYGEVIMKALTSYRVAEFFERGYKLEEACREAIRYTEETGSYEKGVVGVLAVDREGEVCIAYDTENMPSGYKWSSGLEVVWEGESRFYPG